MFASTHPLPFLYINIGSKSILVAYILTQMQFGAFGQLFGLIDLIGG